MKPRALLVPAIAIFIYGAGPVLALPPGGIFDGGPPAAIAMNVPAGGVSQSPDAASPDSAAATAISLSLGDAPDPGIASAADLLRGLNPAAPQSMLGAIAAYKSATLAAQADAARYTDLVSQDQAALAGAQNDLTSAEDNFALLRESIATSEQQLADAAATISKAQSALVQVATRLTTDEAALTAAEADISSTRTRLSSAANRPLSPPVISRLNGMLGI
jgi:hypothetical protein